MLMLPDSNNTAAMFPFSRMMDSRSYVEVTEDGTDTIKAVKEKVKISDWANSGCYCFANGCQLEAECRLLLQRGEQQLSQDKVPTFISLFLLHLLSHFFFKFFSSSLSPAL